MELWDAGHGTRRGQGVPALPPQGEALRSSFPGAVAETMNSERGSCWALERLLGTDVLQRNPWTVPQLSGDFCPASQPLPLVPSHCISLYLQMSSGTHCGCPVAGSPCPNASVSAPEPSWGQMTGSTSRQCPPQPLSPCQHWG